MTTNHTDNDIETVASALDGWASWPARQKIAEAILTALDNAGRITPPWEPCKREDIRKGDRYRIVHHDGSVVEWVASRDWIEAADHLRYFRIPAPAPAVEWPTEPGPYLVKWEGIGLDGQPTGNESWMILDEAGRLSGHGFIFSPSSSEGVFTLLSVKKGGVVDE